MDGNGRWAELRSMPRFEGHRAGMESVRSVVKACSQVGVQYLTLYAFSIENWKRPAPEVRFLMSLLESYLKKELEELHENNVRIRTIGKTNALPRGVEKVLQRAIERTSGNDGLTLTLALSYGARWDIQRAMQVIALDVRRGKLSPEDLTETTISEYLQTSYMPDPDLIIRTSGEIRLSNFLLWEAAYAELFVTDTLWPDFRDVDLYNALLDFTQRERRFGKTSAQLNTAVKTKPSTMERLRNALK
jgi:undecaprenyl diphosphate synthase